jgi:hypothetical protein
VTTITAAPSTALDPAARALRTSSNVLSIGRYTDSETGTLREIACWGESSELDA